MPETVEYILHGAPRAAQRTGRGVVWGRAWGRVWGRAWGRRKGRRRVGEEQKIDFVKLILM